MRTHIEILKASFGSMYGLNVTKNTGTWNESSATEFAHFSCFWFVFVNKQNVTIKCFLWCVPIYIIGNCWCRIRKLNVRFSSLTFCHIPDIEVLSSLFHRVHEYAISCSILMKMFFHTLNTGTVSYFWIYVSTNGCSMKPSAWSICRKLHTWSTQDWYAIGNGCRPFWLWWISYYNI